MWGFHCLLIEKRSGGFRHLHDQLDEQMPRLVGVIAHEEQDESLAHLDMLRLLEIDLPHPHHSAKDQQQEEHDDEPVLAQETHGCDLPDSPATGNLQFPAGRVLGSCTIETL